MGGRKFGKKNSGRRKRAGSSKNGVSGSGGNGNFGRRNFLLLVVGGLVLSKDWLIEFSAGLSSSGTTNSFERAREITELVHKFNLTNDPEDQLKIAEDVRVKYYENPLESLKWSNNIAAIQAKCGDYTQAMGTLDRLFREADNVKGLTEFQLAVIHLNSLWIQFHHQAFVTQQLATKRVSQSLLHKFLEKKTFKEASIKGWTQLWSRRDGDEYFVRPSAIGARIAMMNNKPSLALNLLDNEIYDEGVKNSAAAMLLASWQALKLDEPGTAMKIIKRISLDHLKPFALSHMFPVFEITKAGIENKFIDRSDIFREQLDTPLASYYFRSFMADVKFGIGADNQYSRNVLKNYTDTCLGAYRDYSTEDQSRKIKPLISTVQQCINRKLGLPLP